MHNAEKGRVKLFYTGCGVCLGLVSGFIVAAAYIIMQIPGRAPQSEVKQNLGAIFATQVSYFGETNTFATGPNCFKLIAWWPEGKTRYSYYCGDDEIRCINCERDCRYPNLSAVSAEGFTVMAVGNIDNDKACDVWTIDDAKNLKNVQNDVQVP